MVIALDLAARNGDDLSDDGPERAAVAAKLDRDHAGHETHPHAAICSLPGNEASGRGKDGDGKGNGTAAGSNLTNALSPTENDSEAPLAAGERLVRAFVAAGLPER